VEGGPFSDYRDVLEGLAYGLSDQELIQNVRFPLPEEIQTSQDLWEHLVSKAESSQIEFVADGFYSAGWDPEKREQNQLSILKRIETQKDVDLILAFGTWAGEDLVGVIADIPIMVLCVTDPVNAHLSETPLDSGRDNVHVYVDDGRVERQIKIFHELFQFSRMGVPMDNTPSGQASMGLMAILQTAAELNFQVVTCEDALETPNVSENFKRLVQCLEKLSQESDAIYLTANNGMLLERMGEILGPIIAAKIPSFSQKGYREAQAGVLLSVGEANFGDIGYFESEVLNSIIHGVKPREIVQMAQSPLVLALNLRMAMEIGWNPPFEVLVAADALYLGYRGNPLYREEILGGSE
jgi:ABC-type uncharacterized transport system substrate-binding protein